MSKGRAGANYLMLKRNEEKRQERALEEAFQKADQHGEGRIPVDEYVEILTSNNITTSKSELLCMLAVADKNGDGYITREEFMGEHEKLSVHDRANIAFNIIDRNCDGYISKAEMLQTINKLTEKQVAAIFQRCDQDGDGKLSREEFANMMTKEHK